MRFLLGLLLTLIAASGLVIAGLALLSTWKGPVKPTVSRVPGVLRPKEVQAPIHPLPPLAPPPLTPQTSPSPDHGPQRVIPFEARLPANIQAKHLVLTSLSPAPLEIKILDASKGRFASQLQEGCYQVRGFSEEWGPLFTVDRFCMSPGTQIHPKDIKVLKNLRKIQ